MSTWEIIGLALAAGIVEFIISFFFNYKIYLIAKDKFVLAGLYGAISTLLYMIMSGGIVYLSSLNTNIWILIFCAFMIAAGNFFSALVIKWWQEWKTEHKNKKIANSLEDIEKLKQIEQINPSSIEANTFTIYEGNVVDFSQLNSDEEPKMTTTDNGDSFLIK